MAHLLQYVLFMLHMLTRAITFGLNACENNNLIAKERAIQVATAYVVHDGTEGSRPGLHVVPRQNLGIQNLVATIREGAAE